MADASREDVDRLLRTVGASKGWPQRRIDAALQVVEDHPRGWDLFGLVDDTPAEWFVGLAGKLRTELQGLPNADEVVNVVRQYGTNETRQEAYDWESSTAGIVAGTAQGSLEDTARGIELAQDVGTAAAKTTSRYPLFIFGGLTLGALALGGAVIASKAPKLGNG